MRSTTSASLRLSFTAPSRDHRERTAAAASVSLPRLYLLRFGYLLVAVGLVVTKWPLLINHDVPWPLFEGVETCMLVAMSLLCFLGLRYPLQMLHHTAVRIRVEVHPGGSRRSAAVDRQSAGSGHFAGVLFLPRRLDCPCRHSLALCGRALRDEAGRSLALGSYAHSQ